MRSSSSKEELVADVVLYERRGPAAWVTLNRPDKLNAISSESSMASENPGGGPQRTTR
jgi:hypothetical protein